MCRYVKTDGYNLSPSVRHNIPQIYARTLFLVLHIVYIRRMRFQWWTIELNLYTNGKKKKPSASKDDRKLFEMALRLNWP